MEIWQVLGVGLELLRAVLRCLQQLLGGIAAPGQEPDAAADQGRQSRAAQADQEALLRRALPGLQGLGLAPALLHGLGLPRRFGVLPAWLFGRSLLPGLPGVGGKDGLGFRLNRLRPNRLRQDRRRLQGIRCGHGTLGPTVGAKQSLIRDLLAAVGTKHLVSSFFVVLLINFFVVLLINRVV